MARPGSSKKRSLDQEDFVARLYGGKRSPSSGAAVHDAGDIRTERCLIEAKTTGGPHVSRPAPMIIKHLEKIAHEAWEEGRDPVLVMRYYLPSSSLSTTDGFVDVAIRPMRDDAERERRAEVH